MATLPPINVWRQRVKAMEQLTMRPTTLVTGSEATFGRRVTGMVNFASGGLLDCHTDLISFPSAYDFLGRGMTLDGGTGHTCNTVNTDHRGIWESDATGDDIDFKRGAHNEAIQLYHTWQAANPGDSTYYMLKGTGNPTTPANSTCDLNPCDYQTIWKAEVPVDQEYVIKKTSPATSMIGNYVDTLAGIRDDTAAIIAYFEVCASTPIAPVALAYVRPEATVLGAWAQVSIADLSILRTYAHVEAHTEEVAAPGVGYQWVEDSQSTAYTTTTDGEITFAAVGTRSSDNFPCILQISELDLHDAETDTLQWVDLTNTVSAIFANWNGPYSNFHIMPCSPTMAANLADADAGDAYLARLMPSYTRSATQDQTDAIPGTMEYEVECKRIEYTGITIQNMYVAVQLPTETVGVLLNYNSYPSLA